MLICNMKTIIEKKYGVPFKQQYLYYHDVQLNDNNSLVDNYIFKEDQKQITFVRFRLQEQVLNQTNSLILNILTDEMPFQIYLQKNQKIDDLKHIISHLDEQFSKDSILLCRGQIITNSMNENIVDNIIGNAQDIIIVKPQSGSFCLKFMEELRNIQIIDLNQLQKSLSHINNQQLNQFIDETIKEINDNKAKYQFYQQYQLHHLIAIKLWIINLIYEQINIDLRNNQYNKWKCFIKFLVDALRYCVYFKGQSYRGIRDYQNINYYQKGKIIQWSEISSISKNKLIAERFSNEKGTLFQINLISAKDISQLSYLPEEEEVLLLPFSTFKVEEVVQNQNESIKVKLVELPLPRQPNVILWVDDHPENNYDYAQELEKQNPNISIVFCRSSQDAKTLVKQYKWMIYLEGSNFRIVTDMVREKDGKLNYLAGIDLLSYLFQEIEYKNQVLVFCGDVDKAQEACQNKKIIGYYKISSSVTELRQFIRFQ